MDNKSDSEYETTIRILLSRPISSSRKHMSEIMIIDVDRFRRHRLYSYEYSIVLKALNV